MHYANSFRHLPPSKLGLGNTTEAFQLSFGDIRWRAVPYLTVSEESKPRAKRNRMLKERKKQHRSVPSRRGTSDRDTAVAGWTWYISFSRGEASLADSINNSQQKLYCHVFSPCTFPRPSCLLSQPLAASCAHKHSRGNSLWNSSAT